MRLLLAFQQAVISPSRVGLPSSLARACWQRKHVVAEAASRRYLSECLASREKAAALRLVAKSLVLLHPVTLLRCIFALGWTVM